MGLYTSISFDKIREAVFRITPDKAKRALLLGEIEGWAEHRTKNPTHETDVSAAELVKLLDHMLKDEEISDEAGAFRIEKEDIEKLRDYLGLND